jgi:sugar lactone lactonase YvrE
MPERLHLRLRLLCELERNRYCGGRKLSLSMCKTLACSRTAAFSRRSKWGNGDGSAVDSEGRLYVTSNPGVQVFDKTGKYLGLIPTPRGVISVAFAGRDKKMLYVVGSGAEDANGQPIREGPQQTAATIYKLPMIAEGVKGRAK